MTESDTIISEELKRLSRRIDGQGKDISLLMSDRNILEDILTRMTALENAMHLQRATATENTKATKAAISDVGAVVEAKVDQVSEAMDERTVIVKAARMSVAQKILQLLHKK